MSRVGPRWSGLFGGRGSSFRIVVGKVQGSCVYGAGGVWRCRRLSSGKVFRGWSVLWCGTVRRAWWVMAAGMLVSRRWIVLGSQARAEASARAGVWEKVGGSAGRGHDRAPDAVLREALRRDVVEPGVFRAADAVPWRRVRSWWRISWPGSWPPFVLVARAVGRWLPRCPRSAAGRPGGAARGARLARMPWGQAVRSGGSAGLGGVRPVPGVAVGVVRG